MANDYIRIAEARARQELEQLTQAQQRAIIEAYNSAGKELVRQYRGAKEGTATKALYASYTKKIAEETQQIIEQYAIKGAQVAPSVEKLIMQQAFQMAGLDTSVANDKFENLIGTLGMESVKNVIGGKIYKDGAGLSSRIWQASAMSSNKIQEVITAGLAQNMGAAKLSKLLQDYVNPTARKTWDNDKIKSILGDGYAAWNKNLEYNALRLARTTLSHTATMSMRQAKKVNPYATKIKWHSVHAAGRTCSTCEEMDGNIYKIEECPFDHPNGMCYQIHEMEKSLDEIADELAAWCNGAENEMLDEWWENLTGEKPSSTIKESILYRFMNRQKLKDIAESHPANNSLESREVIYTEYVGTGNSFSINQYLRQLKDGTEPNEYAEVIKHLDAAIGDYQLDEYTKFRRFVDTDYLDGTFGSDDVTEISKQIGSIYRNKQYMSVTVDSNPYFSSRPAIMTIQCQKGTNIFPTTNYNEGELILGRNIDYELVDVIDHSHNPMVIEYEKYGENRIMKYSGLELVINILK